MSDFTCDAVLVTKKAMETAGEPNDLSVVGPKLIARYRHVLGAPEGGDKKPHVRSVAGAGYMITLSPHDTYLFPLDHPRAKTDRYAWFPLDDDAKAGYLLPDDGAQGDGSARLKVSPEQASKIEAILRQRGLLKD